MNSACWFAITSVEVLGFVLHCAHLLFVYIQKLYFWYDYIWTLVILFIGPDIILMLSVMAGRRMLAENNIATTHIDRFVNEIMYFIDQIVLNEFVTVWSVDSFFDCYFNGWTVETEICMTFPGIGLSHCVDWTIHLSARGRRCRFFFENILNPVLGVWRGLLTCFKQNNLICKG